MEMTKKIIQLTLSMIKIRSFSLVLLGIAFAAIIAIPVSMHPYNQLVTIDDSDYVRSLARQAIPISIDLYDPTWGSITIQNPEKVYSYYETLCYLPVIENGRTDAMRTRERDLTGSINFLERSSIHFTIADTIIVEGITYGATSVQSEVGFMVEDIYNEFYTPENLAGLIDRHSHVVLRTEKQRTLIPTVTKQMLREEIRTGRRILDNAELSKALQERGEAIFQIEIYASEEAGSTKSSIPQVYISVYQNHLCTIRDVESAVGSNMHMYGDLQSLFPLLEEGRESDQG